MSLGGRSLSGARPTRVILSRMEQRHEAGRVGWQVAFSIFIAPYIGFIAMGVCWLFVDTDWSGDIDVGVIALGAAVASVAAALFANRMSARSLEWIVAGVLAAALTYAAGYLIADFFHSGFGLGFGRNGMD